MFYLTQSRVAYSQKRLHRDTKCYAAIQYASTHGFPISSSGPENKFTLLYYIEVVPPTPLIAP